MKKLWAETYGSKIHKQNLEHFKPIQILDLIKDFLHLSHRVQLERQPEIVDAVNRFDELLGLVKQQESYGDAVKVLNEEHNHKILSDAFTITWYTLRGEKPGVQRAIGKETLTFEQQKEFYRLSQPDAPLYNAILKYLEENGVISIPYDPTKDALYHERVDNSKIVAELKHRQRVEDSRKLGDNPLTAKL